MSALALPARAQFLNHYQTTYDASSPWHEAVAFAETSDKGYVYVGPLPAPSQLSSHLLLVKLDASFMPVWSRTYLLPGELDGSYPYGLFFQPTDVSQTADGGYLVCGRAVGEGVFDAGFLLHTDPAGVGLSLSLYPSITRFRSCVEVSTAASPTGGVMAVGDAKMPAGHAAVLRTDPSDAVLWGYTVVGVKNGMTGLASYAQVIPYQKKRFAMTGYANGTLFDQDVLLGTIDADGIFGLHEIYGEDYDAQGNQVFEYAQGIVEVGGAVPGLAVAGGIRASVPDT